jgi:hypothetical protein
MLRWGFTFYLAINNYWIYMYIIFIIHFLIVYHVIK